MQVTTYLSFSGDCEAAFRFYEECLDGKLGQIFRYAGTPMADQVPATGRTRSCTLA
jgi:PhnB protein